MQNAVCLLLRLVTVDKARIVIYLECFGNKRTLFLHLCINLFFDTIDSVDSSVVALLHISIVYSTIDCLTPVWSTPWGGPIWREFQSGWKFCTKSVRSWHKNWHKSHFNCNQSRFCRLHRKYGDRYVIIVIINYTRCFWNKCINFNW
jgi:hypothetical protein